VKAWWPNGYGQPVLYDAAVIFSDARGEVDCHNVKIGFRTVELVQQSVSARHYGQSHCRVVCVCHFLSCQHSICLSFSTH